MRTDPFRTKSTTSRCRRPEPRAPSGLAIGAAIALASAACTPRPWVVREDFAAKLRESQRFAVLPVETHATGPGEPAAAGVTPGLDGELRHALEQRLTGRSRLSLTSNPDEADFVIRPRVIGLEQGRADEREAGAVWMEVYVEDQNGWVLDILRTGASGQSTTIREAAHEISDHVVALTSE